MSSPPESRIVQSAIGFASSRSINPDGCLSGSSVDHEREAVLECDLQFGFEAFQELAIIGAVTSYSAWSEFSNERCHIPDENLSPEILSISSPRRGSRHKYMPSVERSSSNRVRCMTTRRLGRVEIRLRVATFEPFHGPIE